MDDLNRRRRQNEPPYTGPDPRFNADPTQSRGFSSSSADRYRPAPLNTSSPSTSRGTPGGSVYSGYYSEPAPSFTASLPSHPLQYQPGYAQDHRQQQNFASYTPDISMYNVGQQAPQNTVYDSTSHFQGRQPAAMQMLSDVPTTYFSSEQTNAPGPPTLQHHSSSTASAVYQPHQPGPSDRSAPLLQHGYPTGMPMGAMPHNAPEIMEENFPTQGPGMEAAYTAYQTALKQIFQNTINGCLGEASLSLLEVSEWLLGHVGDLGLTVDEVALHGDRIRLWGEFNTAWLSIFQKQKDMLESGQQLQRGQSLMTQDFIKKMAKDLIRMCDGVDKYGLVDYQYGVAEEQIMAILIECLDLQESLEGAGADSGIGRAPP